MSSNATDEQLNGFSGFILATFALVSIFVIFPVRLPLPTPLQVFVLKILRGLRIVNRAESKTLLNTRWNLSLSLLTAPIIGVILLLATTTIHWSTVKLGIQGNGIIKPYDVLVLFISLAYISIALDGTGAIEAAASWVSQRGGASTGRLFSILYFFFLIVGCVIGNDPLILSGTPFLAYLTSYAALEPTPWVFSEFMAANTASAVLVSSNPTNVLIAGSFSLNYLTQFTKWTVLPSLVPAVLTYLLLLLMFRKKIPSTVTPLNENPWSRVRNAKKAVLFGLLLLSTIAVLVGTNFISGANIQVWMVTGPAGVTAFMVDIVADLFNPMKKDPPIITRQADAAAELQVINSVVSSGDQEDSGNYVHRRQHGTSGSSALSEEVTFTIEPEQAEVLSLFSLCRALAIRFPGTTHTVMRLPISLLPFAMCEFIMVRGLAQRGWISIFARGFSNVCTTPTATVFFMVSVCAAFLCPLAGTNIGATIILVEIIRDPAFSQSAAVQRDHRVLLGAIYAVAVGSNIGAFSFTFAASLAGLLWRTLLLEKGIHIRQQKFALVNLLPLFMQTVVACAIIIGQLYWFA